MRLSASQIAVIARCPREWVLKYLMKYPEPRAKALVIGSLFHRLCEGKDLSGEDFDTLDQSYPWSKYFSVMLAGYKKEREQYAPPAFQEVEYKTEDLSCKYDEIAGDDDKWYIVERKTAGKALDTQIAMIPTEIQINIYVDNAKSLAQEIWLNPDTFAGVLYLWTYKPSERGKKNETSEDLGLRLTSSTVSAFYTPDRFDPRIPRIALEYAKRNADFISEVFEREKDFKACPAVTASCTRFGRPCPYFGLCHGTISESEEGK